MRPPNPSMTVVVPAFNAARYIGDALRSVALQHRRDVEIIVVDDGSTDGTERAVEKAIEERTPGEPEIKLLRQANSGVSEARNRGIGEARSGLIAFLDADDLWAPTKVARQSRIFEAHPEVDLSFTGFRFIDEAGHDLIDGFFAPTDPIDYGRLLLRNLLQTSTVVGRTRSLEQAGGFDSSLRHYEDYDLWLRVAALHPGNILGVRDQLVDYRRHKTQATHDWNAMHVAWQTVIERAAERDPKAWAKVSALSTGSHLEYCAALAYNAGDASEARRLMLRAWASGGPKLIASPYARSMTAITTATLLPKALQATLGKTYLTAKKAGKRFAQLKEADARANSLEPFNAHNGLWRSDEDTSRKFLYDRIYEGARRLVAKPRRAADYRTRRAAISGGEASELAARCRNILNHNLAPFFFGCADERFGGYLENADEHGFYDRGEKWLIKQSRNLWTFSYMAANGIEPVRAKQMADRGFDYLQSHFLDRENGGYYDRVRSDGSVLISLKLQRHQAHAISGLCEYAALTGSEDARAAALAAFDAIDRNARVKGDGGYHDCLRADWSATTAAESQPHQTYHGARQLDAELHILEALTLLYGIAPEDRVRRKLTEQILRLLNRFSHDRAPANLFYHYLANDAPVDEFRENMHATYGHDLELIWFVFDGLKALQLDRSAALSWARRLSDYALTHSFDHRRGGFYDQGRLSGVHLWVTGRDKVWWVQADAMVSMLEMHKTTGDPKYSYAFCRTLDFVERYFLAPDGGWYRSVHCDGRVKMPVRAAANQGPYHTIRSMIRSANLLDELSG